MTDNEIIKALECCLSSNDLIACQKCPAVKLNICCDGSTKISNGIVNSVIDLINRQKAEIESLEAEIEKQYEQAKADILGNMSDGGTSCHWCIEQHEIKAIKEFAERLCEGRVSNDPIVIAVKVELKELTVNYESSKNDKQRKEDEKND